MLTFLAAGATIIALAIVGIVYSAMIKESYSKFKCSVYLFVNEAL